MHMVRASYFIFLQWWRKESTGRKKSKFCNVQIVCLAFLELDKLCFFFFLNWYHNFPCFLWTCPIEFGLAYLKSHSSLFSDVLCIYNFYVCSVSIKLSWASVNCQILKFNVVIQYLIFFIPRILLFGWRSYFPSQIFFVSKHNHKWLKSCSHTTRQENLKGVRMIKRFNRILTLYFSVHVASDYSHFLHSEFIYWISQKYQQLLKDQTVIFDFLQLLKIVLVFQNVWTQVNGVRFSKLQPTVNKCGPLKTRETFECFIEVIYLCENWKLNELFVKFHWNYYSHFILHFASHGSCLPLPS